MADIVSTCARAALRQQVAMDGPSRAPAAPLARSPSSARDEGLLGGSLSFFSFGGLFWRLFENFRWFV